MFQLYALSSYALTCALLTDPSSTVMMLIDAIAAAKGKATQGP